MKTKSGYSYKIKDGVAVLDKLSQQKLARENTELLKKFTLPSGIDKETLVHLLEKKRNEKHTDIPPAA